MRAEKDNHAAPVAYSLEHTVSRAAPRTGRFADGSFRRKAHRVGTQLREGMTLHGFRVERRERIDEIDGCGWVMAHERSGARLLWLACPDSERAFTISFATPPKDDTGVFHILEHSVLCGSEKFPVKEPFVDLLKSSMQTFLNAMTYPDKTVYPVASTNEKDLLNLMDVYMDAVFHPAIYGKPEIFAQEGWHYELHGDAGQGAGEDGGAGAGEGENGGAGAGSGTAQNATGGAVLVHNGVVFNEMKGALSDPDAVMFDALSAALFPDTAYRFESGGTPAAIPTLTREAFLDEHRRHYRTDNARIVLYGDLDIDALAAWLDERYLTPVAAEQKDADAKRAAAGLPALEPREMKVQAPVVCMDKVVDMPTAPDNACLGLGFCIGRASDVERASAAGVLVDALLGSNEAPLRRALLDDGIADDVDAGVETPLAQPFVYVVARGLHEGAAEKFWPAFRGHVEKLLEKGLDHELVTAALDHEEFSLREADFGYPAGVALALSALSTWTYDEDLPCARVRYEECLAHLREGLENGLFEELLRELFLENGHMAHVELRPVEQDADAMAGALTEKLAGMDEDAREKLRGDVEHLRRVQEAPDSPEQAAKLPRLAVSDIGEACAEPAWRLDESRALPCLRHEVDTRGIVYTNRYFDLHRIAFDDLPAARLVLALLGRLGTAHHSAAEVDTLVQSRLGHFSARSCIYEDPRDIAAFDAKAKVSAHALEANVAACTDLVREICLESDFSDTERVLETLQQTKIYMEQGFSTAGHSYARERARSYYAPGALVGEQMGGVDYYLWVRDMLEHFAERGEKLGEQLARVAAELFCDDGCVASFSGSDAAWDAWWAADPGFGTRGAARRLELPALRERDEAFIVPGDVCFAACGYDRRLLADARPWTGTWSVASRALSFDYLWNEVRVKGGAYGVGFSASRAGDMSWYTFRDPHLDASLARIAKSAEWLAGIDLDAAGLEGLLVATTAGIDAPVKPRALIARQDGEWFSHAPEGLRETMRREVLETTVEKLRALAPDVEAASARRRTCVFGNRQILEGSAAGFELVDLLGTGA